MKSRLARIRPQSEGKSPIWLIVLCDMMTILMLFFLMMFSYTYQPEKQEEFVKLFSVNEIIEAPKEILPDTPPPPPAPDTAKEIKRLFEERSMADSVEVFETETSIRVRLRESILFKTAGAQLGPAAAQALHVLAGVLTEIPNDVIIEGHTDDVPITKAKYRSNWELSVARSYSVIERLIAEGVPPERLVAAGYGEYHPVLKNNSIPNRASNRRVEIVILRTGVQG